MFLNNEKKVTVFNVISANCTENIYTLYNLYGTQFPEKDF